MELKALVSLAVLACLACAQATVEGGTCVGCAPEASCSNVNGEPTCTCPWGFHDRNDDGTECLKSCRFDQTITPKKGRIELDLYSEEACVYWDFEAPCEGTVDVWFPVFDVKAKQDSHVVTLGHVGLSGKDGLAYTRTRPLVLEPPFHITIDSKDDDSQGRRNGFVMEYMCTPYSSSLDLLSRRSDRCLEDSPCDPVASCTNTGNNSVTCTCPSEGYVDVWGDGTECEEVDFCNVGSGFSGSGSGSGSAGGYCSADAECTSSRTGFTCTCNIGFSSPSGDGVVCDECPSGTTATDNDRVCSFVSQVSNLQSSDPDGCTEAKIDAMENALGRAVRQLQGARGRNAKAKVTQCRSSRGQRSSRALLQSGSTTYQYIVLGFDTPAAASAAKTALEQNPNVVVNFLPSSTFTGIVISFPNAPAAAPPPPPPSTPEPTENEDDTGGVAAAAIAGAMVGVFVVLVALAVWLYYRHKAQKVAPADDDDDDEEVPKTRKPKHFTVEGDNFGASNRKLAWGENFGHVTTPDSTSPVKKMQPRKVAERREVSIQVKDAKTLRDSLCDVERGDLRMQEL